MRRIASIKQKEHKPNLIDVLRKKVTLLRKFIYNIKNTNSQQP